MALPHREEHLTASIVGAIGLALAAVAFHAPRLAEPLGVLQFNAGLYFGPAVVNWERLGFAELRGVPLLHQAVNDISQGQPYLNHPPGLSWLFHWLGGREWSMRLPTAVASLVAALAWLRICRERFAALATWTSALVLLLCPGMAVLSQASYEVVVVACGLVVIAEIVTPRAKRGLSLSLQLTAAFVGTWIDWGFAFLCLAAIPLAWRERSPRGALRRLWPMATASLLAASSIAWWMHWSSALAGLRFQEQSDSAVGGLAQKFLFHEQRMSFGDIARHLWAMAPTCWSWPLIAGVTLGFLPALRRDPRSTLAMTLLAAMPWIVLPHPHDYIWLTFHAPFLALCAAGAIDQVRRWLPRPAWLPGVIAAVLVGSTFHASWTLRSAHASTFYARLGAELTRAAEPGFGVAHNFLQAMGYYLRAPFIESVGRFVPNQLEPLVHRERGLGWKFLLLVPRQTGIVPAETIAYLEPFPRQRLPALEGSIDAKGDAALGGIAEAWLYTLSEPPPR
jgi:hypothetical protein